MRKFQELIKKSHVQNHPLFKDRDAQIKAMRENMSRRAQDLDLKDIFSERRQIGLSGSDKTLNAYIQEAFLAARQALNVLDFPILPKLNYNNAKQVKYSSYDSSKVIDAQILFNVRIATVTGAIRNAVIPVSVSAGMVVPPSIILYGGDSSGSLGQPYILAQSTVDAIIQRNSSYALEPMRGMFDPPMSNDELDQRVLERYDRGYQPREIDMDMNGVRRTYSTHGRDRNASNKGSEFRLMPFVHKAMTLSRICRRRAQAHPDSMWAPFYEENLQQQVDQQVPIYTGPEEDDFIISPAGAAGEGFLVSIGDREVIGEAPDMDAAQQVVESYASSNNHFVNVWVITENGQVDLVTTLEPDSREDVSIIDTAEPHSMKMSSWDLVQNKIAAQCCK